MKIAKRKRREAAGFKVGTVQEFLAVSNNAIALIELNA